MITLEQTRLELEWGDLDTRVYHPRPVMTRSKGVHVSGILKPLAIELKLLRDEDQADEMPMCIAAGMAMEEFLAGLYPQMKWQPGEVKRGGIVGSPDGFSYYDVAVGERVPCIDEFKASYKSIRTRPHILNEWMWMQQGMSYCNLHVSRPRHCKFHIWYQAGDYKYPLRPQYWRYTVEFSKQDLANNWAMLQKYKHLAKEE